MKITQAFCMLLVSVSAGCVGYWLRGQTEGSGTFLAAKAAAPLDYLVVPDSFSRIENARSSLETLCTRLRLEVETRLCEDGRMRLQAGGSTRVQEARLERIVRDLEDGMSEFDGTDQKIYVAEDLLTVLKHEERLNRWVEVYLAALYEHPTHPVVSHLAGQAVRIGKLAGREDEVVTALTHVSGIPWDFEGKDKIEAALAESQAPGPLAGFKSRAEAGGEKRVSAPL
jgi:hypothetical protein